MELWLLCQQVSNNLHEVKIMRRYCIQKREDYTLYNKLSREIRYLFWLYEGITSWQCLFLWPGSITLLPFQGNCEKNQGPWPSLPTQVSVTFNPWKKTFQFVTCFDYLYIIFQSGHVCCFPRETMEHWNNSHQVEPRKLWQGMVSCQTNQQSILLISHTNWQNLFNIYNRWRPAVSAADDYLCWWLGLRWLKVWRLLFRSWSILYIAFQYHHCCLVLILIGSPLIFWPNALI